MPPPVKRRVEASDLRPVDRREYGGRRVRLRRRSRSGPPGSVDGGDVGTDQGRRLLVDPALAAVRVVLLEMRKRGCRGDWVRFVVAMVVERHVHERVIREPKND